MNLCSSILNPRALACRTAIWWKAHVEVLRDELYDCIEQKNQLEEQRVREALAVAQNRLATAQPGRRRE